MNDKIRDLQKQLGHVNLLLAEAAAKEKAAALTTIKALVAEHQISETELLRAAGFAKQWKKRRPAKYYDPNSGQSWSGYGPTPKWLEGKNKDDYLIRDEPKPWWPEGQS
jgi:DNA-binding protein H-NS